MASSSSPAATKLFTIAQVAEHNNTEVGVWIIVHDKVYDVTKFLAEHPGGEEVLIEVAGKESTEAFEDVGHSTGAKEMMEKYFIGDIVEHERKTSKAGGANSKMYIMIGSAVVVCLGSYILYRILKSGK